MLQPGFRRDGGPVHGTLRRQSIYHRVNEGIPTAAIASTPFETPRGRKITEFEGRTNTRAQHDGDDEISTSVSLSAARASATDHQRSQLRDMDLVIGDQAIGRHHVRAAAASCASKASALYNNDPTILPFLGGRSRHGISPSQHDVHDPATSASICLSAASAMAYFNSRSAAARNSGCRHRRRPKRQRRHPAYRRHRFVPPERRFRDRLRPIPMMSITCRRPARLREPCRSPTAVSRLTRRELHTGTDETFGAVIGSNFAADHGEAPEPAVWERSTSTAPLPSGHWPAICRSAASTTIGSAWFPRPEDLEGNSAIYTAASAAAH